MKKLLLVISVVLLGGCATLKNGSTDEVVIKPLKSVNYENVECTYRNEEGEWVAELSNEVEIERDGNTLSVLCKGDTVNKEIRIEPAFEVGALLADFGFFVFSSICIIACPIDMATNALYDYPDEVYVDFSNNVTLFIKEWDESIRTYETEDAIYRVCGEVPRKGSVNRRAWIILCHDRNSF